MAKYACKEKSRSGQKEKEDVEIHCKENGEKNDEEEEEIMEKPAHKVAGLSSRRSLEASCEVQRAVICRGVGLVR